MSGLLRRLASNAISAHGTSVVGHVRAMALLPYQTQPALIADSEQAAGIGQLAPGLTPPERAPIAMRALVQPAQGAVDPAAEDTPIGRGVVAPTPIVALSPRGPALLVEAHESTRVSTRTSNLAGDVNAVPSRVGAIDSRDQPSIARAAQPRSESTVAGPEFGPAVRLRSHPGPDDAATVAWRGVLRPLPLPLLDAVDESLPRVAQPYGPLAGRLPGQKASAVPDEVHVHIGRIEVTALHQPATATASRTVQPARKPLSLDEYLAKRDGTPS